MKIGIIGCGYVGHRAADYWKEKRHILSVTTRQTERIKSLSASADFVFLLNHDCLANFIRNQEILLVSVAPGKGTDYASTYLGIAHQIGAHLSQASQLKQIIYTSSTSVYGDLQGKWGTEEENFIPEQEHGKILWETEKLFSTYASDSIKVCLLRLGEIYGPGREAIERLKRMQNTPLAGTGEAYTNLIHVEDVIRALDFALEHRLGGIYNLCNDLHIPRREFYLQLCRQANLPSPQWDATLPNRHSGNKRVSNQKIKAVGFTFTHDDA